MRVSFIFRQDSTNVGDWFCLPSRFFHFPDSDVSDIISFDAESLKENVVVGGGGLLAKTFHSDLNRLVNLKPRMGSLVAWGIGESENIDRQGGFVLPYTGPLPSYLKEFDLVGLRDYGTEHRWVPCVSCMLPQFDLEYEITQEIVIYEHKRIPITIDAPFPRRSNVGNDIDAVLAFLASARVVITNSYHGAYWATLLGRRVVAVPNMSKMYRFKHMPVICQLSHWKRCVDLAREYRSALAECRQATLEFYRDVSLLHAREGLQQP